MKTIRRIEAFSTAALVVALASSTAFGQGLTGTLRGTDGSSSSVETLRGRVTVLLFGGILDPQSPDELPALQRISERYSGGSVDVMWVSLDDASVTDEALLKFARGNGFTGRVLRDESGRVLGSASAGRRPQLPTVIVIDKTGTVAGKPVGGFDREATFADRLAKLIEPLL